MIFRSEEHAIEYREKMRGGNGTAQITSLAAQLPEKARLFAELRLAPGHSIGYHVHENETELFYFIAGKGRVQDDDATFDVAVGDVMSTASGHGHSVENIGAEDLVFVAVIVKD